MGIDILGIDILGIDILAPTRFVRLSIDFLEPISDFQRPITFLLVDKNTKCGYSFS